MHAVEKVWEQLTEHDRYQAAWPDGMVKTLYDFIQFISTPGMLFWFIWDCDKTEWCFFLWAEPIDNGWAWAHFSGLTRYRRSMGEFSMDTLRKCGFKGLLGMIPSTNSKALRLVKTLVWEVGGSVPSFCTDVYADKIVDGTLNHYRMEN